jgi:K+/H+ antiporter YhaU regulatory subunit KhtT
MKPTPLPIIPEESSESLEDSADDIMYFSKQYTEAELLSMFGFKSETPANQAQILQSMEKISENFAKMMQERNLKR